MLIRICTAVVMLIATGTASAQDLSSDKDKLSYSVGWEFGADLKRRNQEFDVEAVIAALRDAVGEQTPKVTLEEMRELLTAFQEKLRQEQLEAFQQLADDNKVKSEEFLQNNLNKTGIVALESGVQYRIIEEGDGARPNMEDTVEVHYRGSKMDGREFDSSFARGVPQSFKVNEVLLGWQEVLPLMKSGSTWQVFVPPELAFGVRGQPPVGPNEALTFDIKLVQITTE
jgi:FKBP-type peptidyl-prolyl cis-trans isomerase FklB